MDRTLQLGHLKLWWTDKNQNAHQFEEDSVEVDSVNQDHGVGNALLAKLHELC